MLMIVENKITEVVALGEIWINMVFILFGSECQTLIKWLEQRITAADLKVVRVIQRVTMRDRKRNYDLYRQSNVLPIVQDTNKNN